ncbi:cannabinoid receptor type 1B-like [Ylistrum balloti]|uniref:cannabinoid receptor type 1B-like n=1 Tax=Ylistrum balloti TaxID=509963 RepID=UPI002905A87A|nr:cannabinoid receptor type 1B-like [Ylistrum balloti]
MNNTSVFPEHNQINFENENLVDESLNLPMKPYLLLILFIQALLSTVGNLIICLMTITMPTLRKNMCVYFILCFSFSDLLFGSATIDHYFQSNLDDIPLWRCLITTTVSLSAFLISLAQAFLICLERTLHILYFPRSSSLLTDKNRTFIVVGTWVFCVVYICVLVASRDCSLKERTVEDFLSSCTSVVNGVYALFAPLYIGVVFQYLYLLYKVKKLQTSVRNLKSNQQNQSEATVQNSSLELFRNIFKTVSVFVVTYVVSFSPMLMLFSENAFTGNFNREMFALVVILLGLNGLISPLLYIWRFKDVRRLFEC